MRHARSVEAFIDVVRKHDPALRALAYRTLGGVGPVDDVMQEAYLRAFRSLDGFKGRSAMRTWLHRIVYTTCVDELRRPRLVRFQDSDVVPDSSPGDRIPAAVDLEAALRELPPSHRAAVWLVDAEGFTYRDAAGVLDVPEGTVASWVVRGRRSLRSRLDVSREVQR